MTNEKYNGWTNRATWLVNVWYNPESKSDVEYAKYDLEEQVDAMPNGVLKDMLCIEDINWDELLEHFQDDDELEED